MPSPDFAGNYQVTFSTKEPNQLLIRLKGRIDVATAASVLKELLPRLDQTKRTVIIVDLSKVTDFDDYGALVLLQVKAKATASKMTFKLQSTNARIEQILNLVHFKKNQNCVFAPVKKRPNIFIRLGDAAIQQAYTLRYMVSFLGSAMICFGQILIKPRTLRLNDTIIQMQKTGVDALPIVALISFLMGFIMAFVSSLQLRQFGASIYVASIVALAMVSELGPIMTAIIVAGRSGSAYAAEIGTMRISDEIDALFTMGFPPTLFLAMPRILAAMIVMPVLVLCSDLFAILGGLLISVSMLDLSMNTYFSQTFKSLDLIEFAWGGSKSVVFAAVIAWVGCLRGFQVRGGAAQVGNAATSAVVSSIFLIILIDSIFAVIRSYW
jgi:phospholipid/cholesterol/gamma-HCH transport system permease protein